SMHELAVNYGRLDRHNEELEVVSELLAIRKAKHGPEHHDTIATTLNLGATYLNLHRDEDGLKLYEELLQIAKRKLGPNHRNTHQNPPPYGQPSRWVRKKWAACGCD